MADSKSFKLRDIAAFKNHIAANRKQIIMDNSWWAKQKAAFCKSDSQEDGVMGFDKTDAEIEKDWEKHKKLLIEENTTYIDIYDIENNELERLFHKRIEDLALAAKVTKKLKRIVESMIIDFADAEEMKKNKDKLQKLMTEYDFEGIEAAIPDKLYLSSLTGWEIDAHIAAEDYELVK